MRCSITVTTSWNECCLGDNDYPLLAGCLADSFGRAPSNTARQDRTGDLQRAADITTTWPLEPMVAHPLPRGLKYANQHS